MQLQNPHLHKFQQSLEISEELCKQNNYPKISNQDFFQKSHQKLSKRISSKKIVKLNLSFNPRQVIGLEKPISPKFQQLLKQMRDLEVEKKIRQKRNITHNNRYQDQKVDEVAMFVNEKLREYEYIIDHKHLMPRQRQSDYDQMKQKRSNRSKAQKILELVEIQQQKLHRCDNLTEKEQTNKQIIKKYHKISKNLLKNPKKQLNCSKIISEQKSSSLKKALNLSTQSRVQPFVINNSKSMTQSQINKNKPKTNFKEIFISQDQIQKNKQIHKLSQLNNQKLTVWNHRLSQINPYFQTKISKLNYDNESTVLNSAYKDSKNQSFQNQFNKDQISEIQNVQLGVQSQRLIQFPQIDEMKGFRSTKDLQKSHRESLLSNYLSKHNPRFVKTKGMNNNKIIQNFDAKNRAKSMLEGNANVGKTKEQKIQELKLIKFRQALKQKFQYKNMHSRKFIKPKDISKDQEAIVDLMFEQENDIFYWTTCRNQKISLLIKGGRKHKDKKADN